MVRPTTPISLFTQDLPTIPLHWFFRSLKLLETNYWTSPSSVDGLDSKPPLGETSHIEGILELGPVDQSPSLTELAIHSCKNIDFEIKKKHLKTCFMLQ